MKSACVAIGTGTSRCAAAAARKTRASAGEIHRWCEPISPMMPAFTLVPAIPAVSSRTRSATISLSLISASHGGWNFSQ